MGRQLVRVSAKSMTSIYLDCLDFFYFHPIFSAQYRSRANTIGGIHKGCPHLGGRERVSSNADKSGQGEGREFNCK